MGQDEGALVGSAATELALVMGETVASGFVPPRPFRVNAGPVHAYVLMAAAQSCALGAAESVGAATAGPR